MTPARSTEVEHLAEQLRLAFDGPAWHGPAVREALRDVTPEQAHGRPIPGAHTIWEIVLHLAGAYRLVLGRVEGEARNLSPEEDWPPPPAAPSEPAWRAACAELAELNAAARAAVARFEAERLDAPLVATPPYTAYVQFAGLPQHDLYHAGQIVLLKRALQGRPAA